MVTSLKGVGKVPHLDLMFSITVPYSAFKLYSEVSGTGHCHSQDPGVDGPLF